MPLRSLSLACVLAFAGGGGCAQEIAVAPGLDAALGADASAPEAGPADAVAPSGPDASSGAPDARASLDAGGGDARAPDGGAPPQPLRFARIGVAEIGAPITALAADARRVFIGTQNGQLYVFDGARVERVWSEPENQSVAALVRLEDRLLVGGARQLHVLEDDGSSGFTTARSVRVGDELRGLAASQPREAWAVARRRTDRVLVRFDGGDAAVAHVANDTAGLLGVALQDGVVHVGAYGGIYRFEQGAWSADAVEWGAAIPEASRPAFEFTGFVRVGDGLWAFGSRRWVLRLSGRRWAPIGPPEDGGRIEAAAVVPGSDPPEVYLGGFASRGGRPLVRVVGGRSAPVDEVDGLNIYAGASGGPGEVWFGGVAVGGTGDPVLLRGRR